MRPLSFGRCGIPSTSASWPLWPSSSFVVSATAEEEEEEEEKMVVKGEVYGREPMEKTSPETRMGTRSPYLLVRSSRASRLMGLLLGVLRVRG